MANYDTTTKFKVDISDLKSAMQDAKRQIALANSEFKATSSSMDDWAHSADGIDAKLTQLVKTLHAQESVLDEYKSTLEQVKAKYGENSKEAEEYQIKLNNQQAVVNKTKKDIEKYAKAFVELEQAEADAGDEADDTADSINDMAEEAKDAEGGFTVLKGAMADLVAEGIKSVISGVTDLVKSLASLADETREYREDMGKLKTAFETAGFSADEATEVYKNFYSFLGEEDRSVEAVNHLAKLVESQEDLATWTNICTGVWGTFGDSLPIEGLTEASNETAKTGQLTGVLADALNWAGVSEDDFQASLSNLNSEQDRARLIMTTLNGLYSDSANRYKENNGQIMEANRAQSNYNDTLAQMGEAIEPLTTEVKRGMTQILQSVLELLQSVDIDALKEKIASLFDKLTVIVNFIIKHGKAIVAVIVAITSALMAMKLVSLIGSTITAIKTLIPVITMLNGALMTLLANPVVLIIAGIVVAIGLLVAGFTYLWNNCEGFREFWINLWEGIKTGVSTVAEWLIDLFTNKIPNAFNNFVNAVKSIPTKVSEFVDSVKNKFTEWRDHMVNTVVNFFTDLPNKIAYALGYALGTIIKWAGNVKSFVTETIPQIIDNIVKWFSELPSRIWTWLQNTITNITTWASNMKSKAIETATAFVNNTIDFIKELPAKIWTWLQNTITKVTTFGQNLIKKAKEIGQGFVDNLIDAVTSLPDKFKEIGSNIVSGIWNGISEGWKWLTDKVSDLANSLLEGTQDALGINSPSKAFRDEVGKWIPAGIAVGVDKNAKTALNSVRSLAMNMVGSARTGLQSVNSSLSTGGAVTGGVVNNFYQTINSPKQLSRLDIYRQSKNLLGYAGGGM